MSERRGRECGERVRELMKEGGYVSDVNSAWWKEMNHNTGCV